MTRVILVRHGQASFAVDRYDDLSALGVAQARGDGKVCLIEGDGSLMMHCQELETIQRHGIRLLMAIMNDGGYGAEFHKFRANDVDDSNAIHGRGDIAAMARGLARR